MPDPTPPTAPRRPFGRSVIARNAWLVPVITRVHRWLYQRLDGRLVAHAGRTQMLLLTTVGRRSGEPRVTPLLYVEDGANLIVVASNGGTERVPKKKRARLDYAVCAVLACLSSFEATIVMSVCLCSQLTCAPALLPR